MNAITLPSRAIDPRVLEWSGALTGLVGSALLATNSDVSGWGFVAFLISNLFWIGFGLMHRMHGMLLMQLGFTATSMIGVYRWMLA